MKRITKRQVALMLTLIGMKQRHATGDDIENDVRRLEGSRNKGRIEYAGSHSLHGV